MCRAGVVCLVVREQRHARPLWHPSLNKVADHSWQDGMLYVLEGVGAGPRLPDRHCHRQQFVFSCLAGRSESRTGYLWLLVVEPFIIYFFCSMPISELNYH